jgi:hypothetical protein
MAKLFCCSFFFHLNNYATVLPIFFKRLFVQSLNLIEVILNGKLFCERARDKINFEKLK